MSYSAPRTWVTGEVVTAAQMNTNVRDNMTALGGATAATAMGTALPGSPADNDRFILVDSTTAPTWEWHLRYNAGSASSFKWEFLGGTPIRTDDNGSGTSGSANTYFTLSTNVVLARAGDYEISYGCRHNTYISGANGDACATAFALSGGTTYAASDNDGCWANLLTATTSQGASSAMYGRRVTGIAASTTVTLFGRTIQGLYTMGWAGRWLAIMPVRII